MTDALTRRGRDTRAVRTRRKGYENTANWQPPAPQVEALEET